MTSYEPCASYSTTVSVFFPVVMDRLFFSRERGRPGQRNTTLVDGNGVGGQQQSVSCA